MVTPDIHWSVHLDLVTGPPETTDDDEIQCLGRMLLNSLEDHVDEAVGDAMGAKKSLQFSLWDHTLAALLKCFRRAEVVQVRGVEGLELASFPSLYSWCLEKWFRLTDLVVEHHHRG